jgi:hypothetical protein
MLAFNWLPRSTDYFQKAIQAAGLEVVRARDFSDGGNWWIFFFFHVLAGGGKH